MLANGGLVCGNGCTCAGVVVAPIMLYVAFPKGINVAAPNVVACIAGPYEQLTADPVDVDELFEVVDTADE